MGGGCSWNTGTSPLGAQTPIEPAAGSLGFAPPFPRARPKFHRPQVRSQCLANTGAQFARAEWWRFSCANCIAFVMHTCAQLDGPRPGPAPPRRRSMQECHLTKRRPVQPWAALQRLRSPALERRMQRRAAGYALTCELRFA